MLVSLPWTPHVYAYSVDVAIRHKSLAALRILLERYVRASHPFHWLSSAIESGELASVFCILNHDQVDDSPNDAFVGIVPFAGRLARDAEPVTCFAYAIAAGNASIVDLLIHKGADWSANAGVAALVAARFQPALFEHSVPFMDQSIVDAARRQEAAALFDDPDDERLA